MASAIYFLIVPSRFQVVSPDNPYCQNVIHSFLHTLNPHQTNNDGKLPLRRQLPRFKSLDPENPHSDEHTPQWPNLNMNSEHLTCTVFCCLTQLVYKTAGFIYSPFLTGA